MVMPDQQLKCVLHKLLRIDAPRVPGHSVIAQQIGKLGVLQGTVSFKSYNCYDNR